ncbi:hypothetical protein [Qipengyuania gaetbuli]|uniref:hypothetical protein n=1 Tax=Qipengyuania gaetbuli TaxID=266952 RepID=UPI001CFC967B|nr:hypothetical protein [Qipengyuania gaetbuli]
MQRGSGTPAEAHRCPDGLYLLFEPGQRPDRSTLIDALAAMPQASVSHDPLLHDELTDPERRESKRGGDWLELLQWGMTFDCLGLSPGPGVAAPPFVHRFNVPASLGDSAIEAIALVPGPHLADAANSLPIVRCMLDMGAGLAEHLPGVKAVSWGPSCSAIEPDFFLRTVNAWIGGGPFPALGLVGFAVGGDGALVSDGLAWFIGQEILIAPELAQDRIGATRMAARLVHELVGAGPLQDRSEARFEDGAMVMLEPRGDGTVRVTPM